jgi:ligand-binding SRPBCC domain-containing protein
MRHTHHAEQWLPYPIATVFDFFANPDNLPRLMPDWQQARIESATFAPPPWRPGTDHASAPSGASSPVAAGKGTRMTITFLPFPHAPFRVPWDAEITDFEWDSHFCDVQRRGPFAYWKHCHRLEAQVRGALPGTLLTDHVEYELPLGPLGDLANRLFVKGQMESIFLFRQKRTGELLPGMAAAAVPDPPVA